MEKRSLLLISERLPNDSWHRLFQAAGFTTQHRKPSLAAVTTALADRPDLIAIDCRFGEATSLQFCQSLRAEPELSEVPVFAIYWDGTADLHAFAHRAGVDVCLTEAISQRELQAKFHAARAKRSESKEVQVLRYADLELDERKYKVLRGGHHIPLSMLQLRLLRFLMEHPGVVFSRRELLEAVWGDPSLDEGTVTVCLVRLRKALVSAGGPNPIRHVRGIGYSLDMDFAGGLAPAGSLQP